MMLGKIEMSYAGSRALRAGRPWTWIALLITIDLD